jgi:2'-5' RNA ligase
MRLFIAINFSDATRKKLLVLQQDLREQSRKGRFSVPENLHLTLAFLGECNTEQFASIVSAMDTVSFQPFDFEINRVDRFRRQGGDIWWAGLSACPPLLALQLDLEIKLRQAGFDLDNRKYSPHITLARDALAEATEKQISPFGEVVQSIQLMQSEHIGGRLIYTKLYSKQADVN